MKAMTYIKCVLSFSFVALILLSSINFAVDPLVQYHQPWFGMEAVITNEWYQNAGVARNFDYDNAIIGNSMCENFIVSDVENVFGGKTVKLTAAGSYPKEWTLLLDIIKSRKTQPDNILINLDPYMMEKDTNEEKFNIPKYLYDSQPFNDVNYIFNFSVINDFTLETIRANQNNSVPDYNTVFVWGTEETEYNALKDYKRVEKDFTQSTDEKILTNSMEKIGYISPYFTEMPDTEFVLFCSPFSIIYWDEVYRKGDLNAWRKTYLEVIGSMFEYDNVQIYFWGDDEMKNIICNLNNYKDPVHFNQQVSVLICNRMDNQYGFLTKENYQEEINSFFDFLDSYDYDAIFDE